MKYRYKLTARFYTFYLKKKKVPACHYIYRKAACHNFLFTKSYGINQPIDQILKSTILRCGNHGLQYKVPILQTLEVITIYLGHTLEFDLWFRVKTH